MLEVFAVSNYRSLRDLKLRLAPLTVVTGANGCGKSNLYRALRLLARAADGRLAETLAAEGGIPSIQWAGPEDIRAQVKRGELIQGTARKEPLRVSFGFAASDVAYDIQIGVPIPPRMAEQSMFSLDPEIKAEHLWQGSPRRPSNTWLARDHQLVRYRDPHGAWRRLEYAPPAYRALLAEIGEPEQLPELLALRERLRRWRFYDGFRTDVDSPLRQPRVAVRTEALHHEGLDLAAALQTIVEIGDEGTLHEAVDDAFPGSRLVILDEGGARLRVGLRTTGLLRPLDAAELSDGTLRYLCLLAALLSPRPPELLVLNEPEASLHPDLLAPLGRLIRAAARRGQLWIVSHSQKLVAELESFEDTTVIELVRDHAETRVRGQRMLDEPSWP